MRGWHLSSGTANPTWMPVVLDQAGPPTNTLIPLTTHLAVGQRASFLSFYLSPQPHKNNFRDGYYHRSSHHTILSCNDHNNLEESRLTLNWIFLLRPPWNLIVAWCSRMHASLCVHSTINYLQNKVIHSPGKLRKHGAKRLKK